MKKKFTFLIAALMLLTMISQPTRLWGQTWTKTDISDLTTSDIFVIVDEYSSNALPNTQATTGGSVVVVSVELSNDKNTITSTVTDNLKWNITGNSTEGYTFYPNGTTARRLYVIANNNGVRVANPSGTYCATFVYNSNKLKSTKSIGSGSSSGYRYIGVYNNQDWRCYTSSGGNITNTNISFYKYVASTTPSCTPDETSWNFGGVNVGESVSKTFTLTTANLTDDIELYVYDDAAFEVSPTSIEAEEEEKETEITITFHPTMIHDGGWTDYLVISSDDFDDVELIELTGEGLCNAPTNALAFQDYELTLTGANVSQTLTPTIGTGNDGAITYAMKTNPGSAGSVVAGTGVFTATATGTYVVTATQALNGTTCGDVVDITIVVNDTSPSCEITPSTGHNFGTILTNTSESFDFSVAIANLEHGLTLSVPSGYEVSTSTIAANDPSPVNVRVTFTPTAATTYNGNLSISGDDFGSPITAALSGTGDAGYTVTFNPYSGTCDPTSIRVIQGESIETLPTASPSAQCAEDDWTFHGWAIAKIDETTTAPTVYTSDYTVNSNHTLHAVYKITEGDNSNTGNVFSSGSYSNGEITWTSTGIVTIKQEQHTGQTAPNSAYVSAPRWYTGNKITITQTTALDSIIVVASTSGYATALANSTYTNASASVCAWDDTRVKIAPSNSSNITIVMGGQSRLSSLTAYYSNSTTTYNSNPICLEKVATPQLSVAAGTYTSVQSVAITCETTGATIKYKTTENGEWQNYSTAISVGENMTIWAKAIKEGMADSDEVSAAYIINLPLTTMDAIFAKATANGSTASNVNVVFNNWVVSGKTSNTAYVTDNEGKGFIIYTNNHGFNVNDKLSGTVEGTPLKLYNGASEFTNLTSNTTGLSVSNNGEITVLTRTIADLSGVNTGAVVTINNLTYNGTVLSDGSNTIKPYDQLYNFGTTFVTDHAYNVTGVYLQYNPKEILPRSAADIVEVEYNITVTQPASGGTISSNKTTAKYGESVTLTASAAANYRFNSWTVMNGETPVTVENNQFTMPKGNVTVTATFVPTYAIEFAAMSNGSVSATPNPAIEGEDVTITIDPDDGFALQSIRAYKKGDTETPVTIDANNQFTMPAYAVTVEATFSKEYTVTYHRNYTVSDETITTVKYGEGANVPVAAANTFDAPTGKLFKIWNTQADGQGDDYDPADVIEDISADIDLYAKWRNIVYHITYNVNGEESTPVDVNYGQSITTLPTASLSPLTFLGWSTEATGPVNVTAPYTPEGIDEDKTLYAVFGAAGNESLTINEGNSGLPTSGYYDGEKTINSKVYYCNQLGSQNPNQNKVIQFKKDVGYLYNETDFGAITSIVITYYSSDKTLSVKAGASENPTSAEAINPNISENVYTFDIPSNCHYFLLVNGNGTSQVSSIEINYESISSVTITNIKTTESLSEIPANTSIMVKNGGILTFTGNNSNPQNLIVEDGGQLIIPSAGSKTDVKATFQKEITAYTEEEGKDNYYLIANPTTDVIDPATVAGMVKDDVDDEDDFDYDLYYFDEAQPKAEWRNYRQVAFNLVNGKGYLYAKSSDITLEFPGTVPPGTTADITLSKSGSGTYAGFNLVGNPLSNNVATMKIVEDEKEKSCSYYKVNSSTGIFAVSTAPITVCEAFMVQAPSNGAVLKLNQGVAKGEDGFNNEVIRLEVSNSKFTDVAYVYFGNHLPLTKINHLNDEAPMLYIHNENSDRAVEVYNNRGEVKSINVNFEAKTMGTYTISAKMVKGEIKYMHLYDRLTGIDTDLLVDDYSFIGAKDDQPGRFILNLESVDDNGSSTGSETFAYQSGDNIIVNGEGELQVFDVTGRMVMSQHINGAQIVNGLNTGVYVFRMEGKVQKVVIR